MAPRVRGTLTAFTGLCSITSVNVGGDNRTESKVFGVTTHQISLKIDTIIPQQHNYGMQVAVITPVFNDIPGLEKSIASVESQTYTNWIHYIYNDASTDGTRDYLDTLPRIPNRVIVHAPKNSGQSAGRNCLLDLALQRGCEYIAFLDSDDTWNADHLEQNLQTIQEQNCDIVYQHPRLHWEDGSPAWTQDFTEPNYLIPKQLFRGNYLWISAVVVRAHCMHTSRFDTTVTSIEDWEMWIQLAQQGWKFFRTPHITANYLVRNTGQSQIGHSKREILAQKYPLLNSTHLLWDYRGGYNPDFIVIKTDKSQHYDADFTPDAIAYTDKCIDAITCSNHPEISIESLFKILTEWHRVLKPSGKIHWECTDILTDRDLLSCTVVKRAMDLCGFTNTRATIQDNFWVVTAEKPDFRSLPDLDWELTRSYDHSTFWELFETNTYRIGVADVGGKTLIDIGANLGLFSILATKLGATRTISVEAQQVVYSLGLVPITQPYPTIQTLHLAAGAEDNSMVFIPNDHVCSKIMEGVGDAVVRQGHANGHRPAPRSAETSPATGSPRPAAHANAAGHRPLP